MIIIKLLKGKDITMSTFYYVKSNSLEEYKHWVEIFNSYGYYWNLAYDRDEFIINDGICYLCIDDSDQKTITWTSILISSMLPITKHFICRSLKFKRILQ